LALDAETGNSRTLPPLKGGQGFILSFMNSAVAVQAASASWPSNFQGGFSLFFTDHERVHVAISSRDTL